MDGLRATQRAPAWRMLVFPREIPADGKGPVAEPTARLSQEAAHERIVPELLRFLAALPDRTQVG